MNDLNNILNAAPAATTPAAPAAFAPATPQGDIFAGLDAELDKNLETAGEFENIPAGNYLVTIDKTTMKLSKKGTPMVMVSYKVIDGDYSKRFDTQFITLVGKDGKWNSRGLGDFVYLVTQITKDNTEAGKANAREFFKGVWQQFNAGQRADLAFTGLAGNQGSLKITESESEDKLTVFRNHKFVAA